MKANKLLLFLALLVTACGRLEVSIEQTPTLLATLTPQIPTNTATAVITLPTEQVNPMATITVPSLTPVLSTATQVRPSSTAVQQTVEIFLVALEDNGQLGILVGCGDSAVSVTVIIPRTQGVLKAALEKLLSIKEQYYGESGLYNALYQSDLELQSVTIDQGKAVIHLTGTVMLGGVCDAPRVEAQIKQTALQFSTVSDVEVFINDIPLEDVLSQK
jgi:sporulation and spore germination protein